MTTLLLAASGAITLGAIIEKMWPGVAVGTLMLLLNLWKDSSKKHDQRIEKLEDQATKAEYDLTSLRNERQALVSKNEDRLRVIETAMAAKSLAIEKLTEKGNKMDKDIELLTQQLHTVVKLQEKMDGKLDRLLDEKRHAN